MAPSADGKIGNGLLLNGSTTWLSRASTADLQLSGSRSFSLWFKLAQFTGGPYTLFYKGQQNQTEEYYCFVSPDDQQIEWAGPGFDFVLFFNPDTSWHLLTVDYDADAQMASIQLDNGTPETHSTAGINPSPYPFQIGRFRTGSAQDYKGVIDNFSIWNRILTNEERNRLYSHGRGIEYPFPSPPDVDAAALLASQTVAYWKMGDGGFDANRADSAGRGNTLFASNLNDGDSDATGKLGQATKFTAVNGNFLSRPSNPDLQITGDWLFAMWFKPASVAGSVTLASKLNEWKIILDGGTDLALLLDSGAYVGAGSVQIDQWSLVVAQYRAGTNELAILFNNRAPVVIDADAGPSLGGEDFFIGSSSNVSEFFDGLIDDTLIMKPSAPLSEDELFAICDYLWNDSNGQADITVTPFDPAAFVAANLKAYWGFNESDPVPGATAVDLTGRSNDLVDGINQVGRAAGMLGNAAELGLDTEQFLTKVSSADVQLADRTVISIWFKKRNKDNGGWLMTKGGEVGKEFAIECDDSTLNIYVFNPTTGAQVFATSFATLNDSNWHMLLVWIVDGHLFAGVSTAWGDRGLITGGVPSSGGDFTIGGAANFAFGSYFPGLIDDCFVLKYTGYLPQAYYNQLVLYVDNNNNGRALLP